MIDLIVSHWHGFVGCYLQHTILFWVTAVEIFPVMIMLREILKRLIDKRIESCVDNKEKENNTASILYFLKDLGPNTASFSIVTLIVEYGKNNNEDNTPAIWILTIVFFVGIMLKEKSRKYTNLFYKRLEDKRRSRWEQSSEQ